MLSLERFIHFLSYDTSDKFSSSFFLSMNFLVFFLLIFPSAWAFWCETLIHEKEDEAEIQKLCCIKAKNHVHITLYSFMNLWKNIYTLKAFWKAQHVTRESQNAFKDNGNIFSCSSLHLHFIHFCFVFLLFSSCCSRPTEKNI